MSRAAFQKIYNSIRDNPEEWDMTHYRLEHTPTGLQLWIPSGWSFLHIDGPGGDWDCFNFIQKLMLWNLIEYKYKQFVKQEKIQKEIDRRKLVSDLIEKL